MPLPTRPVASALLCCVALLSTSAIAHGQNESQPPADFNSAIASAPAESAVQPQLGEERERPQLRYFLVEEASNDATRRQLQQIGAVMERIKGNQALVSLPERLVGALQQTSLRAQEVPNPADVANDRAARVERERASERIGDGETHSLAGDPDRFPAGDEGYHTYQEVRTELHDIARKYPNIARVVVIGKSVEGRELIGLKISDNPDIIEPESENLQMCNVHAREHLTTELCMYAANELTSQYGKSSRITSIVNNRAIWIFPMMNPDGAMFDIKGGKYQSWRKTRALNADKSRGIDMNRNFAYKWGCCDGSSTQPDAEDYRGTKAESAVEVKALADFVRSRNIKGTQRIRGAIDWHSYSELVLWPYGYTDDRLQPGLNEDQARTYETVGEKMASLNQYRPMQSSKLYETDGDSTDWFWGDQRIWAYTMEMFPWELGAEGFYPPASMIAKETRRNRGALLTFFEQSHCMTKAIGKPEQCGKLAPVAPGTVDPAVKPRS